MSETASKLSWIKSFAVTFREEALYETTAPENWVVGIDVSVLFRMDKRTGSPCWTANEISAKKNKEYKDKIEQVLVEGFSKKNESVLSGRNRKNKLINFVGDESKIGQIVNVKITDVKSFSLNGVEV